MNKIVSFLNQIICWLLKKDHKKIIQLSEYFMINLMEI